MGYDTLLLELDTPTPEAPAALSAVLTPLNSTAWTLTVTNTGAGGAYCVAVEPVTALPTGPSSGAQFAHDVSRRPPIVSTMVDGRSTRRHAVPLRGYVPAGGRVSAVVRTTVGTGGADVDAQVAYVAVPPATRLVVSANGGAARVVVGVS